MQPFLHYFLHLAAPAILTFFLFRKNWIRHYLIMLLTMLVDLDHLWATPIFEPCRCSINFHPLHSYSALIVYFVLAIIPKFRDIGMGLLLHMLADQIDCYLSQINCS